MVIDSAPQIDWHGLAPEIILAITAILILIADLFLKKRSAWKSSNIATVGLLAALIPVITLALDGNNRYLFGGSYVVDNYALAFKAFFLIGGYLTILLGADYIREGDYFQGEFWFLLIVSILGMTTMGSARDLILLFVALETVSIPTFVMAGWRRRDTKSNEAAIKYYLIGVMSSAVMLYGMSFIVGFAGTTQFEGIAKYFQGADLPMMAYVAVIFSIVGFAFKISSVPFHQWAPDVYEGAPTPVTAYLSVMSKAAGFVGLTLLLQHAFLGAYEYWMPVVFVMVVATLIVGNLTALKQTNIVRMLAYSSIAQGGFVFLPLVFLGTKSTQVALDSAIQATFIYLALYLLANMGAFACVIAVARRTGSADIIDYTGLGRYEPFLAITMSIFLFSLAGVPPMAGWFAKFVMFKSALTVLSISSAILVVIAAITSVVAFSYYAGVIKAMWLEEPIELEETDSNTGEGSLLTRSKAKVTAPPALKTAIILCAGLTIILGVMPGLISKIGEIITSIS